ncbi:hypothetical protein OV079_43745 [Nannocystis pusilla]|uniref:Uncharacterized protein n=1 Tax=Nannocystis pusilla TaxID=889268 RepID=A0A9X3EXS8_9BACT|nr:hypothetical protein [Nannocystis pusilla]MCY1012338.1 hypothetical protein [Nannocystis pusilla]
MPSSPASGSSSGPTSTRRSKKKLGLPDDDGDNKVVPVDPAAQS